MHGIEFTVAIQSQPFLLIKKFRVIRIVIGIRFFHIRRAFSTKSPRRLGLVVTERELTVEKVKFKFCRQVR